MEPARSDAQMPESLAPPELIREDPAIRDAVARARLIALGEVLLCSSVPTQILLGAVLRLGGLMPIDRTGQLSLPFVAVLSVVDTVVLIALMAMLTRSHGQRVSALWLGDRPVGREARVGLLLLPLVFLMVIVTLNALRLTAPWLHNVETNPLEHLAGTPGQAALFGFVVIFAGGVREELQRAFLLRRFTDHLGGAGVGVIVLSLAFGLGHFMQGWDAVITTGLLGLFWAVIYVRRGSSVAPVVSHSGFNALEILRLAIMGQ